MFPRVVSHYVCLCAEKQNCCAVLAAGHRGAVICADASCSAIKTTAVNFFQNSPTQTKGCAGAAGVTNATPWREAFRAVGFAKCPSVLPPRLRSSFLLFASSGDFIAPYSKCFTRQECAATGYSLLALPNARILRPHTLAFPCVTFRINRSRIPRHCAGRRSVRIWLRQIAHRPRVQLFAWNQPSPVRKLLSVHLLTTREAAKLLDVSPVRIRQLISNGRIAASKHGRDYLLEISAVEQFREAGRKKTGRPRKLR